VLQGLVGLHVSARHDGQRGYSARHGPRLPGMESARGGRLGRRGPALDLRCGAHGGRECDWVGIVSVSLSGRETARLIQITSSAPCLGKAGMPPSRMRAVNGEAMPMD
jgi:hypothetical protein